MIVVDTNIAIAYLADDEMVKSKLEAALISGEKIKVPTIVIAEILSYPNLDEATLQDTRAWLAAVETAPLDIEIAEAAASIRRTYKFKLIDSIVAATAMLSQATLATRDQEFKKITELRGYFDW